MPYYLGIDTSNYTTSAALYNSGTNEIRQKKQLCRSRFNALGLRQSDAVLVMSNGGSLAGRAARPSLPICGVGFPHVHGIRKALTCPAFLWAMLLHLRLPRHWGPKYPVSHQAGHVMAALYSTGQIPLYREPFIAFHLRRNHRLSPVPAG